MTPVEMQGMTRMMSPAGDLGMIPDAQVEAAKQAGFRVMTADDMKALYNRVFMQHLAFTEKRKSASSHFQQRAITRMRGRR